MKDSYTLAHGHIMRPATTDDIIDSNTVVFTITAFKANSGKYKNILEVAVENVDINEKFIVYDDIIEALKHRDFFENYVIVVNSNLFYPTMLFTIK